MVKNLFTGSVRRVLDCVLIGAICSFFLLVSGAGAAPGGGYLLGPEDVISVTVLGHPEMSAQSITVPTTGQIDLPSSGQFRVTGKTVNQVSAEITKRLLKTLLRPRVTVALLQQRPVTVAVLGSATDKTGLQAIKPGWRVKNVLAVIGNFKVAPDLVAGTLTRNGKKLPLNVVAILRDSDDPTNMLLQNSDQLSFVARTVQVNVTGSVMTSGLMDVPEGMRVVEAVMRAGGAAPKAALTKATVKRANGDVIRVNLYKPLRLAQQIGDDEGNVILRANDTITVPEANEFVTVMGEVAKPGAVEIADGQILRLATVMATSGGLSPTVKPETVRITVARQSADGNVQVEDIDPVALMRFDSKANKELQNGDMVSVVSTYKLQTVFVSGEVNAPGAIELKEDMTLPKLITQAGGAKDGAALKRVVIERNGKTETVDLYGALKNGETVDYRLQNGDFVVVPKNTARIFVPRGVNRPDFVLIPEGAQLTVAEALTQAGGVVQNADLKKAALLRQDASGKVLEIPLPMDKPKSWQKAARTPVQNGDVLYVPEKGAKKPSFLEKVGQFLPFGGLFGLF